MTRRILRGLAAAALLIALSAGAASAGGWATIQTDTGNPTSTERGRAVHVRLHGSPARRDPRRLGRVPDVPRDQRRDGRAGRGQGRRRRGRRALRGDCHAPLCRLLDVAGRADGSHRRDRACSRWPSRRQTASCRRWTRARCSRPSSASGPRSGRSTRRSSSPRRMRFAPQITHAHFAGRIPRTASARRSRRRSRLSRRNPTAAAPAVGVRSAVRGRRNRRPRGGDQRLRDDDARALDPKADGLARRGPRRSWLPRAGALTTR